MDSLTQIVLGAAVGEVALGRRIGNRAMLWGAVAGTIPDLDVFVGKLLYSPTGALALHRGITHSIFFAIVFSFLMAWLVKKYYHRRWHQSGGIKIASTALMGLFLTALLGGGLYSIFFGSYLWLRAVGVGLAALAIYYGKRLYNYYYLEPVPRIEVGYWDWYRLFFWSLFTHPLLDCFTTYGTQVFQPFSDYRLSFGTISVVDPIYTIPFLFFLISASMLARYSERRRIYNWIGIGISSAYLIFTIWNKYSIDKVMLRTLESDNIPYTRYTTNPSILNNALWSGTVETDSLYYWGRYSIFDKEKKFKLRPVPKNHHLIQHMHGDYTIETLKWFSNGYYNVLALPDGNLQINDLRFGLYQLPEEGRDTKYVFEFLVFKEADGTYELSSSPGKPKGISPEKMASELWKRIKGI